MKRAFLGAIGYLAVCAMLASSVTARTVEFETTEVTAPDVAVSPAGRWLIFTMLGRLFRLPVEGGTAEQLTFGPYYDTDPAISPDGNRVAFVSDRDRSEGNVFVLDLSTRQIDQVTFEDAAGMPSWAPDGQTIAYLKFGRFAQDLLRREVIPATVKRTTLNGRTLAAGRNRPELVRSVLFLADGRMVRIRVERKPGLRRVGSVRSHIEVNETETSWRKLRSFDGYLDGCAAKPSNASLLCRYWPEGTPYEDFRQELLDVDLESDTARPLVWLSLSPHEPQQFAASPYQSVVYLGEHGRLWKVNTSSRSRAPILFRAQVRLEVEPTVNPSISMTNEGRRSSEFRSLMYPRLSPDGTRLVFVAAGDLWEQALNSGEARQLTHGSLVEGPAFSTDGTRLVFIQRDAAARTIRILDIASGKTEVVAGRMGSTSWPSWSPDGRSIVYATVAGGSSHVFSVNVATGEKTPLAKIRWTLGSRPHIPADGKSLYFTDAPDRGTVFRLAFEEGAAPVPLTSVPGRLRRTAISADGKWLAFQRNAEIWIAPLDSPPVNPDSLRRLSKEGGDTFAFVPDGSALIYASGSRVWLHPISGTPREQVSIRLTVANHQPLPPLLIKNVRALSFPERAFTPPTNILIEDGRISSMDSQTVEQPPGTKVIDAECRYAIPGLFDQHVHIGYSPATWQGFIPFGVTSVRDVEAWLPGVLAIADRSRRSPEPIPRLFVSGQAFRSGHPAGRGIQVLLSDSTAAADYVALWKKWGVDFIKTHPPISWRLRTAIADAARELAIPLVGHGMTVEELTKAVTSGYWSIEHNLVGGRAHADVLQMLAKAGTRWDPTLAVYGGVYLLLRDQPERLNDVGLQSFTTPSCISRSRSWGQSRHDASLRGAWADTLRSIREAYALGVNLQIGTDVGGSQICNPGSSLHWELEFFVEAGLNPIDVLRIATADAATALGIEDDLGTLETGKLADVVLLDFNPLEDIRNTQKIWRVIKGGLVFDPEKLRPPVT